MGGRRVEVAGLDEGTAVAGNVTYGPGGDYKTLDALVYDAIDASNGFYKGHAVPADRSRMNITFNLASEELEKKFLAEAKQAGFVGLAGHRSVGGCRASAYNAVPLESCQALRELMLKFQKENG